MYSTRHQEQRTAPSINIADHQAPPSAITPPASGPLLHSFANLAPGPIQRAEEETPASLASPGRTTDILIGGHRTPARASDIRIGGHRQADGEAESSGYSPLPKDGIIPSPDGNGYAPLPHDDIAAFQNPADLADSRQAAQDADLMEYYYAASCPSSQYRQIMTDTGQTHWEPDPGPAPAQPPLITKALKKIYQNEEQEFPASEPSFTRYIRDPEELKRKEIQFDPDGRLRFQEYSPASPDHKAPLMDTTGGKPGQSHAMQDSYIYTMSPDGKFYAGDAMGTHREARTVPSVQVPQPPSPSPPPVSVASQERGYGVKVPAIEADEQGKVNYPDVLDAPTPASDAVPNMEHELVSDSEAEDGTYNAVVDDSDAEDGTYNAIVDDTGTVPADETAPISNEAGAPDATTTELRAQRFHHSSLAAGKPVAGAGDIRVVNGRIQNISDISGHYRPKNKMFKQTVDALVKKKAIRPSTQITFGAKTNNATLDPKWNRREKKEYEVFRENLTLRYDQYAQTQGNEYQARMKNALNSEIQGFDKSRLKPVAGSSHSEAQE